MFINPAATPAQKAKALAAAGAEEHPGGESRQEKMAAANEETFAQMEAGIESFVAASDRAEADCALLRRQASQLTAAHQATELLHLQTRMATLQAQKESWCLEIVRQRSALGTLRVQARSAAASNDRSLRMIHQFQMPKQVFFRGPTRTSGVIWATEVLTYLREIHALCAANGFDGDEEAARLLIKGLEGPAMEWVVSLRKELKPEVRYNYGILSVLLVAKFGGGRPTWIDSQSLRRSGERVREVTE
jgi:hypothetical protein